MVFIGINLGLSGGVLLLLGVLVLMALVLVHGLRTANPKNEPRLVPVRMRSRRNVVRPGDEFLASTPSRAPPVLRRPYDDLGDPPRGA